MTGSFDVTVENGDPVIDSMVVDQTLSTVQPLSFWAVAEDPGPLDTITFDWDLDGDGEYDDLSEAKGTGVQTSAGVVSLNVVGSYVLGVRVSDGEGGEVIGSFQVDILQAVPTLPTPARALLIAVLLATALLAGRRAFEPRRRS